VVGSGEDISALYELEKAEGRLPPWKPWGGLVRGGREGSERISRSMAESSDGTIGGVIGFRREI
jgi:hypothetical protein